jgi:hypothetical protein
MGCNVLLEIYQFDTPPAGISARYLRFTALSYYGWYGAGLEYLEWNTACTTPSVVQTQIVYPSPLFVASNVLTDACEVSATVPGQYYLQPNLTSANLGFVVDTGCAQRIDFISLKNTHDGDLNDR